jgi:precorrin-2 methylase
MLYLIGLGLSDETDITVKGLEIVRRAARVYLEAYTSILLVDKSVLVGLLLLCAPPLSRMRELTLMYSRRVTMGEKSSSRIARWWSRRAMIS